MLATFELPAVRLFTEELGKRFDRCTNGEGMLCANLEQTIDCTVTLCRELRKSVNAWARAIFEGRAECDPEVERLLKQRVEQALKDAASLSAHGRQMDRECNEIKGLHALNAQVADLGYLLDHWVSPRRSVSPAPRTTLSDAAEQEIRGNLAP